MTNRTRFRERARALGGGASYDADALAYIAATGELFPEALNALVLGIKAAGLWDDHMGSIKKAIGVPSLAASLIDLRNTAFNGTAVNTPGHSATAGWSFAAASSQYIEAGWISGAADSKSSLNSVHVGGRVRSGGGGGQTPFSVYLNPNVLGLYLLENGTQFFAMHDNAVVVGGSNPGAPASWLGTRTGAATQVLYKNGASFATGTAASVGIPPAEFFIGAHNDQGTPNRFYTGRISLWHAGAGLDATQSAALTTLFNAYATAAGET